jgi:23S rRNA pseudouridine955/2504/2580 synthase
MADKRLRPLQVSTDGEGQRLDNFLLRELRNIPRTLVYRLIRTGQVRVNGGRVKVAHRLRAGDQVRVPPFAMPEGAQEAPPPRALRERLGGSVVWEDDSYLVLDKPSGIPSHGGTGLPWGVIETWRWLRPGPPRLELLHRLDRDTSGLLMLAKGRDALLAAQRALAGPATVKGYICLVRGQWLHGRRRVESPIKSGRAASGERLMAIDPAGRPAISEFRLLQQYRHGALLEVWIGTGRTHQIRVHAAGLGHPLAGDDRYGDERYNRRLRDLGLKRLFLHAHRLELSPSGNHLALEAPLPGALKSVLDAMEGL